MGRAVSGKLLQENITGSAGPRWVKKVTKLLLITYRNITCSSPPSTPFSLLSFSTHIQRTVDYYQSYRAQKIEFGTAL